MAAGGLVDLGDGVVGEQVGGAAGGLEVVTDVAVRWSPENRGAVHPCGSRLTLIWAAASVGASLMRCGQAGRDLLGVLDGRYYCVVLAVGQVDGDPGFVAVAGGERDALVLMEASHPGAGKLRACLLQAVNFGDAVRYGAHAAGRTPGEWLISVGRLGPLPARHFDRDRVIGNQQVRHETAFSRAPATGCQMLCSSLLVRTTPTPANSCAN